jgi:hypothetical protein
MLVEPPELELDEPLEVKVTVELPELELDERLEVKVPVEPPELELDEPLEVKVTVELPELEPERSFGRRTSPSFIPGGGDSPRACLFSTGTDSASPGAGSLPALGSVSGSGGLLAPLLDTAATAGSAAGLSGAFG